jgi:hypothetical protein
MTLDDAFVAALYICGMAAVFYGVGHLTSKAFPDKPWLSFGAALGALTVLLVVTL